MAAFNLITLADMAIHVGNGAAHAVAFAASELQRYLRRMTGLQVPVETHAAVREHTLVLAVSATAATPTLLEPQSFAVLPEPKRITLVGGSARATLDAAYALLEQCGCRWALHGAQEETVPQLTGSTFELAPIERTPPFQVRGYCSDIMTWHYTQPEYLQDRLDDDRAFIDWMAKSGANTFFYIRHPFDTQLSIPELLVDFRKRGIELEYGGHVMPLLLPRELFPKHPEYFPQTLDGTRTDHGNLCTSQAGALAAASANGVECVRENSEMSALHIWGADLWQGGWCRCPACLPLGAQDQSLRVCNAVAQGLQQARLDRPVCYLAYHDTLDAHLTLRPDQNVVCEFAPRERCYGHAMNDPECSTNRRYAAALERYVELFDGRVRLFEYYGDAILFFGCTVPLTHVIAADMAYYRSLGIHDILMLQFGAFSLWAYPQNFLTFAAAAAGDSMSSSSSAQYCRRFGAHATAATALFAEIEDIMRTVVTYGDIRRPPRSAPRMASLRPSVEAALPRLLAVAERLERLGDEALGAQAALVRYTLTVLDGVCRELQQASGATGRYAEALRFIDAVDRRYKGLWGSVDLAIVHSFFTAAAHAEE